MISLCISAEAFYIFGHLITQIQPMTDKPKDDKKEKVFNTRLPASQVEQIRAYSYYSRAPIKDVVEAAIKEFFESRAEDTERALNAYRNKDRKL
jgi:NRPS condensation-like uncharacterized protein